MSRNKKIQLLIAFLFASFVIVAFINHTTSPAINQTTSPKQDKPLTLSQILEVSKTPYEKFFVPTTHFSSLEEGITSDDLKNVFSGQSDHFKNIYILEENEKELANYFGKNVVAKKVGSIKELISKIQTSDIALIPLDKLEPQLKVIKVDDQNIFDKSISNEKIIYPKTISQIDSSEKEIINSNRNIKNEYQMVLTGVSAISRTVQYVIDKKNDPIYPAREVMEELKKADITTIDSESSFFNGCPTVSGESLTLCGKPSSIEAFKAIGADVIDLTGNHQSDFGSDRFTESLGYLDTAGFQYFGGGKNKSDASKVLYKEIGGKKIAFLGYAYFDSLNGESYGTIATDVRPGVNFYSPEKVKSDIAKARESADFVILDYQFTETYSYAPLSEQVRVFRNAIDSGADIVIGIQAHQPQKIEFYKNKPIFYGLGNFFFDQMWSDPTRQGLIPRLTFYEGRLASVELLTTLLYDYSQPRFTNGAERNDLLKNVLPEDITQ